MRSLAAVAAIVAFATLSVLSSAAPAAALPSPVYVTPSHPGASAGDPPSPPHRTRAGTEIAAQQAPPPRIEINPRRLLYRRCKDWYVIQDRPSGRVLFPQTHCWWVRG
jgi:hypothetical protein